MTKLNGNVFKKQINTFSTKYKKIKRGNIYLTKDALTWIF